MRANIRIALLCACLPLWPAARAADIEATVRDHHGKPVPDAVVTAVPVDEKLLQKVRPPDDSMDQVDKQFVPFVKPVMLGSSVQFPNSDHVRHQVYSFSAAKTFELPLYGKGEPPRITFDKPGVVILGCNIHDWMLGYVFVVPTPYFAKTSSAGGALLTNLPPGQYTLRVWHPGMEQAEDTTRRVLQVPADGTLPVEWRVAIKSSFHVPRMSSGSAGVYP